MSSANFNDATIQKAFIGLYNLQGGLINIGGNFSTGNCCFKASDATAGQMLHFNGHHLSPGQATSEAADCASSYPNARYRIYETTANMAPLPLPNDYFTTRPATVTTNCGDSTNPGVFMRRHAGLN
jgi:hypothetical protein